MIARHQHGGVTMMKAPRKPEQTSGITAHRPVISGRRHVISAGHYLAAHAGFAILEAGGNAFDAGVAAGIALGVLQSDLVNVAGVAPIILYHAESRQGLHGQRPGRLAEAGDARLLPEAARRQDPARAVAHGRAGGARCLDPDAAALGQHELRRGGGGLGALRQGGICRPSPAVRDDCHASPGLRGVALEPGHLSAERAPAEGRRDIRAERSGQQPAIHDRRGAGGGRQGAACGAGGGAFRLLCGRSGTHHRCLSRGQWRPAAHGGSRRVSLRHRALRCRAVRRAHGALLRALVPRPGARADAAAGRGHGLPQAAAQLLRVCARR